MIEVDATGLPYGSYACMGEWRHEGMDVPGFANVSGLPPAHSLTSRNVNEPVSATRPVSCIRASIIPSSPASLPSEYCWYSPCRSYTRYTPSSLSTTSRSSPVHPNRIIFPWSHCTHSQLPQLANRVIVSIHTE